MKRAHTHAHAYTHKGLTNKLALNESFVELKNLFTIFAAFVVESYRIIF